jgi:hypothetical protein
MNHSPNAAESARLATPEGARAGAEHGVGWVQRVSSVLFVLFCFELGIFLLVYPWTTGWSNNYFAWVTATGLHTGWHDFWDNSYVRGAVSGLGAVNLWIAIAEVCRFFTKR